MKLKRFLGSAACLMVLFAANNCFAATSANPADINYWNACDNDEGLDWKTQETQYLDVRPSATLWGFIGKRAVAKGQALWPFGGDGCESIFFGIVEGAGSYSASTGYSAGLGVGYRKTFNGSYILGAYLTGDYNRSPNSFDFVVFNPGVEYLDFVWDLRANAYIPVGGKNWFGPAVYAEQLQNYQFINVINGIKYDHLFRSYEETATGIDAEIGRLIPIPRLTGLKGYIGGYHFFMNKTDSVDGIEGRIVYPFTKHSLFEIRDSYDGVKKNCLLFGLKYMIGGFDPDNKDNLGIVARLSDSIEHNFANFASGNSGVVNTQYEDVGGNYVVQ